MKERQTIIGSTSMVASKSFVSRGTTNVVYPLEILDEGRLAQNKKWPEGSLASEPMKFCPHFFETVPRPFAQPKSLQPVNQSQLNKDLIYEMRCWLRKMAISWKVFDRFSSYEDWLKRKGKW